MSEQFSSTPIEPSAPLPPVKLWTPRLIGFSSFFFGFPAGIVLASINWMRMGLTNKAIIHLAGGAVGALVFVILLLLLPQTVGNGLGFLTNIGMVYYLRNQTKNDIEKFKASSREVQNAHWFGGCLIGFVLLGLFLTLILVIGLLLALVHLEIHSFP